MTKQITRKIQNLIGQTISTIDGMARGNDKIYITLTNGSKFLMYHAQDCCESVQLEDVCGDVEDLIGSPIVRAEESSSGDGQPPKGADPGCFTWTFYIIGTSRGTVTLRWLGTSNGYYSEEVNFIEIVKE